MIIDKVDQKTIFQDFKNELNSFKKQIEKKNSWETISIDIEKYEKALWKWLKPLEKQISNNIERKRFSNIVDKLISPTEQVDTQDIVFLETVLDSLESKEVEQTDLDALKETIKELSPTKLKLSQLKQTVAPEVKKVEEKITSYKEKLKSFSKKHPIWTKALIMLLPASLVWLFKKKEKTTDTPVPAGMWNIWKVINKIKWWFSFLNDWMAKIAMMFFTLPWVGAPKEMQDLLAKMSELKDVNPEILKKFGGSMKSVKGDIKEVKKVSEEEVEKYKNKFKARLPKFVKNTFGKNITEAQVNKIMWKLNFKEMYEKTINNPNIFDGLIEWIKLPFEWFFDLILLLKNEKIINKTDIVKALFTKITGKFVEYWTKSVWLLTSVSSIVLWKVSINDFKKELWKLYNKDPDLWNAVLFSLMYRTWWWMLRLIWSVAEFMVATTNWLLFDNRSVKDSLEIAKSSLKWNIDFHIKTMEDIISSLPDSDKKKIQEQIETIQKQLSSFNKNAKIVKAFNEAKKVKLKDWEKFYDVVKEKYINLFPNDDVDDILHDFKNINTKKAFRSMLVNDLEWIWTWLNREVNNIKAYIWKIFLWNNSEKFVINNLSKRMQSLNKYLVNTIKEDGFFSKLKSKFYKLFLFPEWMKIQYAADKTIFKFKDVKTAEDFAKNFKTLIQSSPETVKDLIWHAPIIAIAWIDLSENKPLSNRLKDIVKDLMYWVPFVGPITLIHDGSRKNNFKPTQIAVWSALFIWDTYFLIKARRDNEVLEFITRPITDVADLFGMISRWWANIYKFSVDGVKLYRAWDLTWAEFLDLIRTNFKSIWKLFESWKWKLWLILWWLWIWELVFASNNSFKKDMEQLKKECKNDINCMDMKIKKIWSNLNKETKAEFIALAYGIRTWNVEGVTWKYENGKYQIILHKEYGAIPSITEFNLTKWRILGVLQRYWEKDISNKNVTIDFSKSLLNKVFTKNKLTTKEQKEKYLLALWYDKQDVENMIESVD